MTEQPRPAAVPRTEPTTDARRWVKPELRRLRAGSAEVGANPQRPEGQIAFGGS